MQSNRFTHVNDTPAVQNAGILQFSEIRPQSLCNSIIPWSIKYIWSNTAHSLLILKTPNCSLIRGHFPVRCGGRCTAPGGVGLWTMSGRLRAVSGRLRTAPGGVRTAQGGSGRLRTAFSRTDATRCCQSSYYLQHTSRKLPYWCCWAFSNFKLF